MDKEKDVNMHFENNHVLEEQCNILGEVLVCFLSESEIRRLVPIPCLCVEHRAGVRTHLA